MTGVSFIEEVTYLIYIIRLRIYKKSTTNLATLAKYLKLISGNDVTLYTCYI